MSVSTYLLLIVIYRYNFVYFVFKICLGTGNAQFNGQFPVGVFGGVGQAQFDGSGQINVFSNDGFPVGTFQNFAGQADFAGTGFAAAQGIVFEFLIGSCKSGGAR